MDRAVAQSRHVRKRQPLGDGTSKANAAPAPSQPAAKKPLTPPRKSTSLPHHESAPVNGGLTVQNATSSPENKRLSAITNEDQIDSKRSSQISTTSTNASAKGLKRKTAIGPWRLGRDIGKGAVGKVRKVKHLVTGEVAAAKIVGKKVAELARAESLLLLVESSQRGLEDDKQHVIPFGIQRELAIMKLLDHPNIVKLKDVWENRSELYLIMELVDGGELFDYIDAAGGFKEDQAVWIFRQLMAAVLHCHRLGIHHRDLKPENILVTIFDDEITGNENLQIKLADFGMAALQPKGTKLTTPCGSIHYAAPEVFEKSYDGAKIDVWSLGVILYVMITGKTPYTVGIEYMKDPTSENLTSWYNMIKSGDFEFDESLSKEAFDLIARMMDPRPERRISLQSAWRHPLFRKYNTRWAETAEQASMENWIGNQLSLKDWDLKKKKDIDREVLTSLRCLWHNEKEETMVARLLSHERNQEKRFYKAISRFKEDSLEDYIGLGEGLSYSRSDYHHMRPTVDPAELPPLPHTAFTRTTSNFSILNDDLRKAPPPSVSSYDPFRSSRNPVVGGKENYTSVTVHGRRRSTSQSLRRYHQNLQVDAAGKGQNRLSVASSSRSASRSFQSPRRPGSARRSISRASLHSSVRAPHGQAISRPSSSHKRNVNFSRVRRTSSVSALPDRNSVKPALEHEESRIETLQRAIMHEHQTDIPAQAPPTRSIPAPPSGSPIRSRKENQAGEASAKRPRRGHTNSQVIDTEARKVSTELEKYCEEVFNRSSIGSSVRTAPSNSQTAYETPSSSFSNTNGPPYGPLRPLPTPPEETPNTYMTRELAETRKRLIERLSQDANAQQNATYQDVLAQLDALLNPESAKSPITKRISSAPETRPTEYTRHLPIISEESRPVESEERRGGSRLEYKHRATSGPQNKPLWSGQQQTIRVIDQSPPRVAPLNIRKVSGKSTITRDGSRPEEETSGSHNSRYYGGVPASPRKLVRKSSATSSLRRARDGQPPLGSSEVQSNEQDVLTKKPWFKRRAQESTTDHRDTVSSGLHKHPIQPTKVPNFSHNIVRPDCDELEPQNEKDAPTTSNKQKGFFGFLSKRRGPVPQNAASKSVRFDKRPSSFATTDGDYPSNTSNTAVSINSARSRAPYFSQRGSQRYSGQSIASTNSDDYNPRPQKLGNRDLGVQRSLIARIFNIKPATKIICFNAGRGKVRQELVRLLRGWRSYGVRDVHFDRNSNLVWGRLAPGNYLGIKPVAFVVQLFAMLEDDRRNRLCIVRFTQRNGAASSFRRIADTIENVMSTRGLLVVDEGRKHAMEEKLQVEENAR
ncbi:MAG: hypothetical protein M1828_004518 [Chrysothrix sp. TS-e1954]|nr:MAG: hypothetical protein M1828_004518 [Chrysothrix sp. TS-e1954]